MKYNKFIQCRADCIRRFCNKMLVLIPYEHVEKSKFCYKFGAKKYDFDGNNMSVLYKSAILYSLGFNAIFVFLSLF